MRTRTRFLHWENAVNASVFEVLPDECCSFLTLDADVSAGVWAAKGNGIKWVIRKEQMEDRIDR